MCVCAQPKFIAYIWNTIYKERDHLFIKDGEYQKEIHEEYG